MLVVAPIIAIVAVVAGIELSSGRSDAKADAQGGEKPAAITGEQADAKGGEKPAAITVPQADAAVRRVIPNITVESLAPSLVEGLWEVVVVTPQGKRIAYMDAEGKFLISGALIDLSNGTDLTRERVENLNRVDFASISLDDAIVMGNPNAARKVVVFDDPD
ncbi:MAG: hypothetical protein GTN51_09845 [Armatimonadetes bacterium]|nr:hypothetical protein [Armatimonadota bacterium]